MKGEYVYHLKAKKPLRFTDTADKHQCVTIKYMQAMTCSRTYIG